MKKNEEILADPDDMFADTRMTFGEHIEDLRSHLLRGLYGFLIGLIFAFFIGKPVLQYIARPVEVQLGYYWERYNLRMHKEIVEGLKNGEIGGKQFLMPRYRLDLQELAQRLNLPPVHEEGIDLLPDFLKVLEDLDMADAVDPKLLTSRRWMFVEADPGQWTRSIQRFNQVLKPPTLSTLSPQEAFMAYFYVSMVTGVVISSPWLFYQIWAFIAAGLYPHEKRLVNVYLPFSLGLFLTGVAVCELFVIPKAVEALLWFNEWLGLQPDLRFNEWLGFAIMMPVVFGISFQTPLVMLFTNKIGLFDVETFRGKRRIAWFLITVFAAVITPSTDAISCLLLAVPMCFLYELGILLCLWQPRSEFEDLEMSESEEMIEV